MKKGENKKSFWYYLTHNPNLAQCPKWMKKPWVHGATWGLLVELLIYSAWFIDSIFQRCFSLADYCHSSIGRVSIHLLTGLADPIFKLYFLFFKSIKYYYFVPLVVIWFVFAGAIIGIFFNKMRKNNLQLKSQSMTWLRYGLIGICVAVARLVIAIIFYDLNYTEYFIWISKITTTYPYLDIIIYFFIGVVIGFIKSKLTSSR